MFLFLVGLFQGFFVITVCKHLFGFCRPFALLGVLWHYLRHMSGHPVWVCHLNLRASTLPCVGNVGSWCWLVEWELSYICIYRCKIQNLLYLIDTPSTNQDTTWWVIMNQHGFVSRYVLVQGLEQGEFLQMPIETRHRHLSARSFRVLAFPCLAWLALVEIWARTCGDTFCGSRPHIRNRRMASITLMRSYNGDSTLYAGWLLQEEDIEAWMDEHGVHSSLTQQKGMEWDGPWHTALTVMTGWEMMEKATCYHRIGLYRELTKKGDGSYIGAALTLLPAFLGSGRALRTSRFHVGCPGMKSGCS